MPRKPTYCPHALAAAAAKGDAAINEIRKRARVYRCEKDWHLPADGKHKIYIQPKDYGLIRVSTGYPSVNCGHHRYSGKCLRCGTHAQFTLSQILGRSVATCCDKNATKYYKATAKLSKHSALQVRANKLCGGCPYIQRCSNVLYECKCDRGNVEDVYQHTPGSRIKLSKHPVMSGAVAGAKDYKADLAADGIPKYKKENLEC